MLRVTVGMCLDEPPGRGRTRAVHGDPEIDTFETLVLRITETPCPVFDEIEEHHPALSHPRQSETPCRVVP